MASFTWEMDRRIVCAEEAQQTGLTVAVLAVIADNCSEVIRDGFVRFLVTLTQGVL